jgi:hypothetical protein
MERLHHRFLPGEVLRAVPHNKLPRIDYVNLAQEYQALIDSGECSSKTEVARRVGKSRVWVSRVLKGIKQEDR